MSYSYDDQNIFAKILRGEIPCNKVLDRNGAIWASTRAKVLTNSMKLSTRQVTKMGR